jgi:hypothetical protein
MTRTRVGYSSHELGATLLYAAGTHASFGFVEHIGASRSSRDQAADNIQARYRQSSQKLCVGRERDRNTAEHMEPNSSIRLMRQDERNLPIWLANSTC